MHWSKFKYENKQMALNKKLSKQEYGSYALHSALIRSVHPQNFITIACIVLEICTGQNSNMGKKTPKNKGQ